MSVSITINGELKLDETAGLQDDDVNVIFSGGVLSGGLDSDFLTYLNGLGLTGSQQIFAAKVEGASQPNLVSVTADAGETIGKLFFSDAAGNDFDGDQVFISAGVPLQTANGDNIYLWSALNGRVVLASTSASGPPAANSLVAAFYIEAGAGNTSAKVECITFTALAHPDGSNPDDTVDFSSILRVSAVITAPIGDNIQVDDDGPTITAPFDANPNVAGVQTPEQLGNAAGQTASGVFGYDLGADTHLAAFYTAGGSDFVDANGTLAGVQLALTGTTSGNDPDTAITNTVVTRASEDGSTAVFNFSFDYDKDPITSGVQTGTATGSLAFDKDLDTYTVSMATPVEGFSFDILHTSGLLAKQPTGNTGHPNIVVEKLAADNPNTTVDEDFYVQFTADVPVFGFTVDGQGPVAPADTSFNNGGDVHDMTAGTATWVSATQSTNGVAGDTIQKDEVLTLRFFSSDILGDVASNTEKTDPTATASGIAIKFDGIGNNEDLLVLLDLIDKDGADNILGNGDDNAEITRAVFVENGDIYKHNTPGGVPAPYSSEFSLDNNDGLVVIESNDYNASTEDYEIQGIQIMQSGNGLTGSAINLNRVVGDTGGSSTTTGLQAFEAQDQDVLKIVDIGFIQSGSGSQDANLDFSFRIADADADMTALQHILVNVSDGWIV